MRLLVKNILLLSALAFSVVSCDRMDRPNTPPNTSSLNDSANTNYATDNTGRNIRDRDGMTLTSGDQSENDQDRNITARIRQSLMRDDSLSSNAKNIKIITINGTVTLRGPVATAAEKDAIGRKAQSISGVSSIDNQLEISRMN